MYDVSDKIESMQIWRGGSRHLVSFQIFFFPILNVHGLYIVKQQIIKLM